MVTIGNNVDVSGRDRDPGSDRVAACVRLLVTAGSQVDGRVDGNIIRRVDGQRAAGGDDTVPSDCQAITVL